MSDVFDITILIHTYNIQNYLPRCLDSIIRQTYPYFKLVLIDDQSTDQTYDICVDYQKKDNRIVVYQTPHMGLARQRNCMFQYINTDYFISVDGDDFVEPDYIKHLVDAQKKYDADLVISRVAYETELLDECSGAFPQRGECYYCQDTIPKAIPQMLLDRRLNYLYGKIYRTSLFQGIHVNDNVKQGSDTIINCQYIVKTKAIVLIDDVDYHYIKYNNRAVTSYKGEDAFDRLILINTTITDQLHSCGYLTDALRDAIDERILLSAVWCVDIIIQSDFNIQAKKNKITQILQNINYRNAYNRQSNRFNALSFTPIDAENGSQYMYKYNKLRRIQKIKAFALAIIPNCFLKKWRLYKTSKETQNG